MGDLANFFDRFNRRARVYPALLLFSPILANIILLWPSSPLIRLAPLVAAIGVQFFVADLIRGAGQRLEAVLAAKWGGLPAQRALWLTGTDNPVLTERRRIAVERITGLQLPTKQLEKRKPNRAGQEYDAAVRELIPHVRNNKADDLLRGENIRYNFRRNSLAVRRAALTVASICALGDGLAAAVGYQPANALTALAVSLLILAAWARAVTETWVKQAANTYSNRFYEAIYAL